MQHWERQGLQQWEIKEGMYAKLMQQTWLEGIILATTDEVISKRLEDERFSEPIATIDGIALFNWQIKIDPNSNYLRHSYQRLHGEAMAITREEFDNIPSKAYLRGDIENCTDKLRNPLWLELSRFQMPTLRKYFEAASKNSSSPLGIILPEDNNQPMLYPVKLGRMSTGALLSIQYLDEKSAVAGYKVKARP